MKPNLNGSVTGKWEAMSDKVPFDTVTPQTWQKALRCLSRGDKNVTKSRAQGLFPNVFKITHANADALLLAHYTRQTRKP